MATFPGALRSRGQIRGPLLAGIAAGIIVVLAAIYFLRPAPTPEPIPAPQGPATRPLETVAPAQSGEERGDSGREVIQRLRASPDGIDYAEAHAVAGAFLDEGRYPDAQLLYFFAARGGYAPAAFDLASMYDPNLFSPGEGLMEKPDLFQAYKWYRAAREGGNSLADERLAALRIWAENAASSGDSDAERLLLQWESTP